MKKVKNFVSSTKYKEEIKPELTRVLAIIAFTFIYGVGLRWFLEPPTPESIELFTGGIPGIGQVLKNIIFSSGNENAGRIFMSLFVLLANIPILILGWFGVSKKFTIYSLISVIIQFTVIGYIPHLDFGMSSNINDYVILRSVLGGLLTGIGIGGTLKFGGSTGGFDIIAQWWSLKKGGSVGFVSMILNVVIAFAGALVAKSSGVHAGIIFSYTIIRIIVTTVATDKIHTAYQFLEIEIITENPKEMVDHILHVLGRGVTLSKVEGAYSTHEKTLVMCVISTYELPQMTELIKTVDERAFVIAKPVKSVIGNFKKKRIA